MQKSCDWSNSANISEETKEYIGKIIEGRFQRLLRDKARNKRVFEDLDVWATQTILLLCWLVSVVSKNKSSKISKN